MTQNPQGSRAPVPHVRAEQLHQRLDLVLANITDYAIFAVDIERRVVWWSAGAELILRYRAEDIVGQSADAVFTPEDRAASAPEREMATAIRDGRADDERWHMRKDGTRFFGSGVMAAIRDEQDRLIGFAKIMRDFTERQRAAEALARSEERYRLLVESVKDYAIFMLDTAGRVIDWTKAAERILGYHADDARGRSFAMFFTEQDRKDGVPHRELETVLREGHFHGVGWRVRRDGTRFWGEETAAVAHDGAGRVLGVSKITRDITERMHAEAERERLLRQATEANRLKDEFLGTISHELRTPLNSILGWTRLLRDGALGDGGHRRALEIIERNARSQAQLIDDLLDVSRIITGKLRLRVEPISLIEGITSALDAVHPAAEAKRIHVSANLDPAADVLTADRERIEQIIWNLLTNAIKFTPPDGRITIITSCGSQHVEIAISDTGVGIAPEFLPYVFDRFRQAESGTTRTQAGLGLGLAIVRHLVELHGGTVVAESGGRGAGATFRVRLPFVSARPTADAEPEVQPTPSPATETWTPRSLAGIRVVALDDDRDARELIAATLTRLDADVVSVASVAEALAAVETHRPHVVLVDIAMPDQDGYAFLRQLRQQRHDADGPQVGRTVPAVAVTAYARDTDRSQALEAGFDAHISKPVDLDALARVVDTLTRDVAYGDRPRNDVDRRSSGAWRPDHA